MRWLKQSLLTEGWCAVNDKEPRQTNPVNEANTVGKNYQKRQKGRQTRHKNREGQRQKNLW